MRYGIESRMKPKEATRWTSNWRKDWKLLKWYERKKDRNKALEALNHRTNDPHSFMHNFYEYRPLDDAKKAPKPKKRAKVKYPEYESEERLLKERLLKAIFPN